MKYLLTLNEYHRQFEIPWIHSVPKDKSDEIYTFVSGIAREMGEKLKGDIESVLGSGSYGTAFELEGGKVLKFTDHEAEAHEAFKIIKSSKDFKYLVKYYDIVRLTGGDPADDAIYVIVMERVEPLDEDERDFSRAVWDLYPHQLGIKRKKFYKDVIDNWYYDGDEDNFDEIKAYIKKYWDNIQGMLQDCQDLGVLRPDIHTGNIGRRSDGTVVFFDISDCSMDALPNLDGIRTLNVGPVLHSIGVDLAEVGEKPTCSNKNY